VRLEAFLLDHDGSDLYGQTMRIDFIERLRDERRFPSKEALMEQIAADVARTRELAQG
jgi:riboflavin kinase/FMN adenylyltransferase